LPGKDLKTSFRSWINRGSTKFQAHTEPSRRNPVSQSPWIRTGKENLSSTVPDILPRLGIDTDCWKETLQRLLGPNKTNRQLFRQHESLERSGHPTLLQVHQEHLGPRHSPACTRQQFALPTLNQTTLSPPLCVTHSHWYSTCVRSPRQTKEWLLVLGAFVCRNRLIQPADTSSYAHRRFRVASPMGTMTYWVSTNYLWRAHKAKEHK